MCSIQIKRSTSNIVLKTQKNEIMSLEWGGFRGKITFFASLALHRLHY